MEQNKKPSVKWFFACGKPWYKKWWVWVLGVLLAILPPVFINLAYMKGLTLKEANTAFSAGECLSYYGTLLGTFATIVVLYITLSSNQKVLQNSMQENRIREHFEKEIELAHSITNILLLKKYNDIFFEDKKSLVAFMHDINYVYFETLERLPTSDTDLSYVGAFYKDVDQIRSKYKKVIDKFYETLNQKPGEEKEAYYNCRRAISCAKNEFENGLLFSEKGLETELKRQMNRRIDQLYGLKGDTTNDKT